jgi:PPOX class probable F420-dependent enzyme
MPAMSPQQVRAFLSGTPRTAKVACVRPDGSPHVTPVWFLLDGDDVLFNTGRDTVKGAAIRREPRVCLCVDDDRPPFAFVVIRGVARVIDDLAEVREWAGRLGARYLGDDGPRPGWNATMAARNGVPTELLVRVTPTSIVAEAGVSG